MGAGGAGGGCCGRRKKKPQKSPKLLLNLSSIKRWHPAVFLEKQ